MQRMAQRKKKQKQLIVENHTTLTLGKKSHLNSAAQTSQKASFSAENKTKQKNGRKDSTSTLDLIYTKNQPQTQVVTQKCKFAKTAEIESLYPLQICQRRGENDYTNLLELFCKKKHLQKKANIQDINVFLKLEKITTMQRLQPFQNGQFG